MRMQPLVFLIRPGNAMHKLPQAVCCVIRNEQGQLLFVSRKDDKTAFGLPGGKVDVDETPRQAIIREVKEETGLDVIPGPVIYETLCPKHAPDGVDYYAYCFLITSWSGNLATDETGVLMWGSWKDQEDGWFATYNKGVAQALELIDQGRWSGRNEP